MCDGFDPQTLNDREKAQWAISSMFHLQLTGNIEVDARMVSEGIALIRRLYFRFTEDKNVPSFALVFNYLFNFDGCFGSIENLNENKSDYPDNAILDPHTHEKTPIPEFILGLAETDVTFEKDDMDAIIDNLLVKLA